MEGEWGSWKGGRWDKGGGYVREEEGGLREGEKG